jgi:hypothetical protein
MFPKPQMSKGLIIFLIILGVFLVAAIVLTVYNYLHVLD